MWHPLLHAAKVCFKFCHSTISWSEKFQNFYILHEKLSILYWLPSGFRDYPLIPELWNFVSNISACHYFPPWLSLPLIFRTWSYIFKPFPTKMESPSYGLLFYLYCMVQDVTLSYLFFIPKTWKPHEFLKHHQVIF